MTNREFAQTLRRESRAWLATTLLKCAWKVDRKVTRENIAFILRYIDFKIKEKAK